MRLIWCCSKEDSTIFSFNRLHISQILCTFVAETKRMSHIVRMGKIKKLKTQPIRGMSSQINDQHPFLSLKTRGDASCQQCGGEYRQASYR